MQNFEERLKGGHHNSLGNTVEIVEEVLSHPEYFNELFQCYFSEDELVRLRISNAIKRVCLEQPELVIPYVDKLLNEVAAIDQASTQWTLAILFRLLDGDLTEQQREKAKAHVMHNLQHHDDWIVLNNSIETMYEWAVDDKSLRPELMERFEELRSESRKSVAARAKKYLAKLQNLK